MMPLRNTGRLAAIVLITALLGACGGLIKLPNDGPAPGLYNLTAPETIDARGTRALLLVVTCATTMAPCRNRIPFPRITWTLLTETYRWWPGASNISMMLPHSTLVAATATLTHKTGTS